MKSSHFPNFILILLLSVGAALAHANTVYQSETDFLNLAFHDKVPEASVVWMRGDLKKQVGLILGHPYPSLRIRYWMDAERSAWILEEIGKERPITTGIIINAGKIERVKVLVFRESRGSEVRHDAFTDQFKTAMLTDRQQLDRSIDGITGATLSVRALKKLARLALYLDSQVASNHAP